MQMDASAGRRPLRYTNRLGRAYYIRHSGPAGRYVACTTPTGALAGVPAGYEICESVNGHVSVRRIRPSRITASEQRFIQNALSSIRPRGYQADVKSKFITVFASALDWKTYTDSLDAEFADGFAAALEEILARKYGRELANMFRVRRQERDGEPRPLQFYPVLQFELQDRQRRLFKVKRIYFTGDQDWLSLETLSLPAAVMKYLPHLGKDSFFDLL